MVDTISRQQQPFLKEAAWGGNVLPKWYRPIQVRVLKLWAARGLFCYDHKRKEA